MYVRWYGLSCFEFSDGEVTVVCDPHDGKSIGLYTPNTSADVVLCSHNSFARNCSRVIKGDHTDFVEHVGRGEADGFSFTGLRSVSLHMTDSSDNANSIYLFEAEGLKVAITGCLGRLPDANVMDALKGADIITVPVGAFSTMSLEDADRFIAMVRPKIVIPTDFKWGGITFPLAPIQDFMEGKDPEDFIHVGNEVEFEVDDLSDFRGYWIFD